MNLKNISMNCIDDQLLQKYIDGECTENERAAVKLHLSVCLDCLQKHTEMEKLSAGIKGAINSLTIENIEIPAFTYGAARPLNRNFKPILYSLAAASILLFVLLIVEKKNEPPQKIITIVQSVPAEVDANRPAGEQDLVIEVYDDKGQCSEYFIQ
jgi:hypothetical protein